MGPRCTWGSGRGDARVGLTRERGFVHGPAPRWGNSSSARAKVGQLAPCAALLRWAHPEPPPSPPGLLRQIAPLRADPRLRTGTYHPPFSPGPRRSPHRRRLPPRETQETAASRSCRYRCSRLPLSSPPVMVPQRRTGPPPPFRRRLWENAPSVPSPRSLRITSFSRDRAGDARFFAGRRHPETSFPLGRRLEVERLASAEGSLLARRQVPRAGGVGRSRPASRWIAPVDQVFRAGGAGRSRLASRWIAPVAQVFRAGGVGRSRATSRWIAPVIQTIAPLSPALARRNSTA